MSVCFLRHSSCRYLKAPWEQGRAARGQAIFLGPETDMWPQQPMPACARIHRPACSRSAASPGRWAQACHCHADSLGG